jgi:hypothetical protein
VKSKAPPKKAVEEKPADLFLMKEPEMPKPAEVKEVKKEVEDDKDEYTDNWDISDHDLQDKSDQKAAIKPKNDSNIVLNQNNVVNFDEDSKDDKFSPPVYKPAMFQEPETKIDFFGVDDNNDDNNDQLDLDALENDFNNKQDENRENPFGQSITKELLQQSKKEIDYERDNGFEKDNRFEKDYGFDKENDFSPGDNSVPPAATTGNMKRNLEIEIDNDDDYSAQNEKIQENFNSQLQQQEAKHNQFDEFGDQIIDNIDEIDVLNEFDRLCNEDEALKAMLGPGDYNIEEKLSIVQAYKRGGGI